jgi:hypothetical protein
MARTSYDPQVRVLAIVLMLTCAARARADESHRLEFELGAFAIGSIEVDKTAQKQRSGLAPQIAMRGAYQIGAGVRVGVEVGTLFGTGYGNYEGAATIAFDRTIAKSGNRTFALGPALDLGYAIYEFDAALVPGPSSGFVYYGPFARALVQLHVLWRDRAENRVGLVIGAGAAVVAAQYIDSATGGGTRVEPTLEVALESRF